MPLLSSFQNISRTMLFDVISKSNRLNMLRLAHIIIDSKNHFMIIIIFRSYEPVAQASCQCLKVPEFLKTLVFLGDRQRLIRSCVPLQSLCSI